MDDDEDDSELRVKAKVSQVKAEDFFDDEFEDWTDNDEDDGDKKMWELLRALGWDVAPQVDKQVFILIKTGGQRQ